MFIPNTNPFLITSKTSEFQKNDTMVYASDEIIAITSNQDFEDQGWPGLGTFEEPFVIEGLEIVNDTTCISISGTTSYFIIRNCNLSAIDGPSGKGVELDGVTNGVVDNCIFYNKRHAISIRDSSYCTFSNSTVYNGGSIFNMHRVGDSLIHNVSLYNNPASSYAYRGGYAQYCHSVIIDSCNINHIYLGFWIYHSPKINLTRNTIHDIRGGDLIKLESCDNAFVIGNTFDCLDNGGVVFQGCWHCTIADNILINCGMMMYGNDVNSWLPTFSNNTVGGRPIGYFKSLQSQTVDCTGFGQVIFANCTNLVISGGDFSTTQNAVVLGWCSDCNVTDVNVHDITGRGVTTEACDSIIVSDCTITSSQRGIAFVGSSNCVATSNYIHDFIEGIWMYFAEISYASNNHISGGSTGVRITDSSNCIVNNNVISDSNMGVGITSSSCNATSNTLSSTGYGILCWSAYDSQISNNTIDDSSIGINIQERSKDVVLLNNNIQTCDTGLNILDSDHCFVNGGTFENNMGNGLEILDSYQCAISNIVSQNNLGYGILLDGADQTSLFSNFIRNNSMGGIVSIQSELLTIEENEFLLDGLVILGETLPEWNHTINDNLVNGKELGYYAFMDNFLLVARDFGQLILVGCVNTTVLFGDFSNTPIGLQISFSFSCAIADIASHNNSIYGAKVYVCMDISLFDCNFSGASKDGVLYSDSNTGVLVNCSLNGNTGCGLRLENTDSSIIMNNSIYQNIDCGIFLDSSSVNNIVCYNTIGENEAFNAWDDGMNNLWDDDDSLGNSWSDYNGHGVYYIAGDAASIDRYPTIIPEFISPDISYPNDITVISGSIGNVIRWSASDTFPDYYELYVNDVMTESGIWDWETYTVPIDGLNVGSHNFTLIVYDMTGNYAYDSVIITVVIPATPTPTTPTTGSTNTEPLEGWLSTIIGAGVIGGGVIVVCILLYQRKQFIEQR